MKESILIIMESSPDHIDQQAVKLSLLNINGVKMVHNLYIWQLTVDNVVLAGHLVVTANCNIEQVLQKARILLKEQHNITKATIQCERYQPQIMLACDHCNELWLRNSSAGSSVEVSQAVWVEPLDLPLDLPLDSSLDVHAGHTKSKIRMNVRKMITLPVSRTGQIRNLEVLKLVDPETVLDMNFKQPLDIKV